MRVSILVSDNRVYIDGVSVEVDLSSLKGKIRAVQWGVDGLNKGHIEMPDYTNITLTKELPKEFKVFVQQAQDKVQHECAKTERETYEAKGYIQSLLDIVGD